MELAEKRGFTLEEVRIRIADNLGSLVKRLLEAGLEKTLMVTGGDTLLGAYETDGGVRNAACL